MRTGSSTINYLLGDHLGSTAITTDSSGSMSAEIRYYPWGTERYNSGSTPTTFHFTGQRLESSIGLYYYGARWYDPYLNRWIQPDSTIPSDGSSYSPLVVDYHETRFLDQLNQENNKRLENPQTKSSPVPTNSQSLDRYSYVNNNPVRYNDPTGHKNCEEDGYNCPGDNPTVPTLILSPTTTNTTLEPPPLTNAQKVGKALTTIFEEAVLVAPAEISLVAATIAAPNLGPAGIASDAALITADIVIADFGLSLAINTVESINSGHDVAFSWTLIPAVMSDLPTPVQVFLHYLIPGVIP
jgi:RHS repeat-associated protein